MATNRVKFYADVHVARAVADAMRRQGVDFVLACDRGMQDEMDDVHLAAAHDEKRVLITQDADFLALHQQGMAHSGIIYFPQGTSIGHMVQQLLLLHEVYDADDMNGRVEFL